MKKIVTVVLLFVVAGLLGFATMNKKEDPTTSSSAPVVNTYLDNLIIGAKYNPDNVMAIWSESFDGTFPPAGWLNLLESGTYYWQQASVSRYPAGFPTHSGSGMAEYRSFSASSGMGSSLISSVFSLTSGIAKVGFWMLRDGVTYQTNADKVDMMINTTASSTGATLLGTINRARALAPVEAGPDGWYYYEFSIPGTFNTATNYLIIKSTSAYGNDMYVDDVSVSYALANDVGMVSVDVSTPIMPVAVVPKATVKNFGSAVQTFPVTMSITPGAYTNTQTVTALAAGLTQQVSFASWTPAVGTYTIKVITQLGTDMDKTNDTLVKSVTVTTSAWTAGTVITSGSYMGGAASYMRNDSGWVVCTGGNAPNLTTTLLYNVRANTWSPGATMLTGNVVHAMATLKDTAYVIGGYGAGTTPTTIFDKYNIRTNTWTSGTAIPTAIGFSSAVAYQDSLIYLAGGYNGTSVEATVRLYNSNTNTWRTATPLPATRFGGAFSRTGDTLVYVGGGDLSVIYGTTYVGVISQTDRSVITWTTGAAYPPGAMYRFNAGMWMPGKIIIGGGSPAAAWTPATPNPAYIYNVSANTWAALPNLPVAVLGAYTGAVKYGNTYKFILASGYNGTAAVTNVQIYTDLLVGITPVSQEVPKDYNLSQNYPNPFNPTTKIDFSILKSGFVTLKVYDILGKEISTLVNDVKQAGIYSVDFNASSLTSGIYFYKIQSGSFESVKRMMLVK